MERLFIDFSVDKLRQLETRIQHCLTLLTLEQIWWRGSEESNSVGNLVLHLSGNVRQWVISAVGGAPDIRQRAGEFAARGGMPADQLIKGLKETMDEAVPLISNLSREKLTATVVVQGYNQSVVEVVYHVVEHFALHAGQIMYATKLLQKVDLGFYRHLHSSTHSEKTP
ncbi:MAG TPA: DUF1572 family protein [Bryobacteraceae bacterium]|nr:DUF1572 family protein [Bryobacteraceae bacterium]